MKRLSANILAIAGSDVGRRVLGFFTVAYLARTVGPSGFGLVNIGFAILSYALLLSGGGLPAFGARAIARGEDPAIAGRIAGVRLALAAPLVALVAAGAYALVPDRQAALLFTIFSLSQFAAAFLLDWYFQGREEMGTIGAARLVSAAVYLLFVLVFVASAADLVWVAAAAVAGDVMASLVTVARFQKEQKRGLGLRFAGGATLFREAFPIGFGAMIAHMTVGLPTLAIGAILSAADAGIYSAAAKLVTFLLVFDRLLGTLLLPASSRLYAESPERLSLALTAAFRWAVRIALPLCVGASLLAGELIGLVFGSGYAEAALVLRILVWYLLLTMVHTIYTAGLLAAGEERRYGRVMATSAVLYLVAVTLSTWRYGVAGTAVAVVVAELGTLVLMRSESAARVAIAPGRPVQAAFVAAAFMGAAVVALSPFPLAVRIAAGGAIYAAVLALLGGVTSADFAAFRGRS